MGPNHYQQQQPPPADPPFDGGLGSDRAATPAEIVGAWIIVLSLFAILALGSELLDSQSNDALTKRYGANRAPPVDSAISADR